MFYIIDEGLFIFIHHQTLPPKFCLDINTYLYLKLVEPIISQIFNIFSVEH